MLGTSSFPTTSWELWWDISAVAHPRSELSWTQIPSFASVCDRTTCLAGTAFFWQSSSGIAAASLKVCTLTSPSPYTVDSCVVAVKSFWSGCLVFSRWFFFGWLLTTSIALLRRFVCWWADPVHIGKGRTASEVAHDRSVLPNVPSQTPIRFLIGDGRVIPWNLACCWSKFCRQGCSTFLWAWVFSGSIVSTHRTPRTLFLLTWDDGGPSRAPQLLKAIQGLWMPSLKAASLLTDPLFAVTSPL